MAERKIKVAFLHVSRIVLFSASVSFFCSMILWKHLLLSEPIAYGSIAAGLLLTIFLFQLRFVSHMTVDLWIKLWGILTPLFTGSLLTLPFQLPFYAFLLMLFLIIGIGIWAAYRFYPLNIDKRLHKSRFSRFDEMETLLAKTPIKDSLLLGYVKQFFFLRHYICIRPTKEHREIGHSLIIAPSGMGKTTIIRSQIAVLENTSIIVTDPKGELFLETAGDRAKKGDVFVLDPTQGVGNCYDPLHNKREEGEYLTIAQTLVFRPEDRETYWAESASRMIMYLFQAARLENIAPLIYLRHMSRLGLTQVAKRLNSLKPELATLFLEEEITEAKPSDDRKLKSVWSTLTTYLTPILTETLVRCFARSDFTAETILRGERPVTLYLRLSEEHLDRLSPFVRLVIAGLGKEMIATWNRYQGRGCRNVFIFHDEAGIFPLPNLDKFVSTAMSKNITYNGYYQSTGQLEDVYGKEKARTIRSNMYSMLFLKPNDTDDSERIEEKLGRGSQFAESINKRQGSEFSEGLTEQGIAVMSARDLEEMNENHAIIFHGNYKPIKAHRLKWWQSDILKKRQGIPPPTLSPLPDIPPLPEISSMETVHSGIRFVDPDEAIRKKHMREEREERASRR